jgi:hypothetical protein
MRDQGTRAHARVLVFCGFALLLMLLGGTSTVDAHSGMPPASPPSLQLGAVVPQGVPTSAIPAPSMSWVLATLAIGATIAGAGWLRHPRRLAVALSLSLAVFACETALHSAHHLNDPKRAEHCAVYSASLHLSGLEAAAATPELPRPLPTCEDVRTRAGQPSARVLSGPPSRAPPVLPA